MHVIPYVSVFSSCIVTECQNMPHSGDAVGQRSSNCNYSSFSEQFITIGGLLNAGATGEACIQLLERHR